MGLVVEVEQLTRMAMQSTTSGRFLNGLESMAALVLKFRSMLESTGHPGKDNSNYP